MTWMLIGFVLGVAIAIPAWIASRRLGIGRGLQAPARFRRHAASTFDVAPVVLRGRYVPGAGEAAEREDAR
ncbi:MULTISPECIES: hypothetical protein [Burkholderia]|uniref:Cellulose biosynthesis protein BcsF n=1 Tax=Burkholderia savannae TaxID=1637837 RepID=A0ABR5TBE5_9BURK|nr:MULTISPECIES: hypothetical protein [Burkholderia]AOJ68038.1 hypothetical protein WS78_04150 [Burkholderia savannae]AOK46344.1 hypothetical protein WT60_05390 [Burkholderia sp. MSMB617WGS]KGR98082.1 hypothetical protein X946_4476 [Burkholderia sp. ABCPW 111]KVG40421.1 hypothetical protein WS77_17910 [Burkholderia sp. MSMB0265]KVG84580.1 hypothetical protein WS81_05010 [Burkholderia sp. MSMB2040]